MTHLSSEAERLADWLQANVYMYPQMSEDEPGGYATEFDQKLDEAAALLRRIPELEAERDQLREALSATQPAQAEQEVELRRSLAAAEATISERNAEIVDLHKRLKAAQADDGKQVIFFEPFSPNDMHAAQSGPAAHWHRLYLQECQAHKDHVARLGAEIEGLEAEAAQAGKGEAEVLRDSVAAKADRIDRLGEIVERQQNAMRAVMGRLTEMLDEDQFAHIENLVTQAGCTPPAPASQPAAQGVPDAEVDAFLAEVRADNDSLRDGLAAKADRIDRLGEIVERLQAAGGQGMGEQPTLPDLTEGQLEYEAAQSSKYADTIGDAARFGVRNGYKLARASYAALSDSRGHPHSYREHLAQQAEVIDVEGLVTCLTHLGIASPEGGIEAASARLGDLTNRLIAGVHSHFKAQDSHSGTSNAGILEQCARWCDDQAKSDWIGRKASDMVRAFASHFPSSQAQQPAGDVARDAARWRAVENGSSALTLRLHNTRSDGRAAVIDAAMASDLARKAGGEV